MRVKRKVLSNGHASIVAFVKLAKLRGPEASETEMGVTIFTKNDEGRNFDFHSLKQE